MIRPVPAGADMQAVINAAEPGDILDLEAGATFLGNYTVGAKPDGVPIALRGHATLRSPNNRPALRTVGPAAGWTFEDVRFVAEDAAGAVVQLGDGLIASEAGLPRRFVFERCVIIAEQAAKNGLELNAADVTLRACSVTGVKRVGQETHAIVMWNGTGPFLIEDCTIEAGACGLLVGGAMPAIPGLVPAGLTFRRNHVTRPLSLRGGGYNVKNLLELKNCRDAVITGNIFEHNWPDGQSGYAILFTVRANGPNAPQTTIQNVLFESNIVRHAAMGFSVLGLDNQVPAGGGPVYPSTRMDGLTIRNNLLYDIDRTAWGGAGHVLQITGGPRNLTVEQNTMLGTGNILHMGSVPLEGFRFVRNIVQKLPGTYGIKGDSQAEGNATIAAYCPDAVVTENVLAGCTPSAYSAHPGNLFLSLDALNAEWYDAAAGDYRGDFTPAYGCDQDAIEAACTPPPPEPEPEPQRPLAERLDALFAQFRAALDVEIGQS